MMANAKRMSSIKITIQVVEIVVIFLMTIMLFPTLFLIVGDILAGVPLRASDAVFLPAALLTLLGLWVALTIPDSLYQRRPVIRSTVKVILAIAALLIGWLVILMTLGGSGYSTIVPVVAAGVTAHQLIRLIRL